MGMAERRPPPHWSLALYLDYLGEISPPQGDFDPAGTWEHVYDVFPIYAQLHVTGQAWSKRHQGGLRLKRRPVIGEDAFQLEVESNVTFLQWLPTRTQRTAATIKCAADTLATPISWELESVALSARDGSPVPLSHMRESGATRDRAVELTFEGGRRTFGVGPTLTSNWSLFDALQRLPRGEAPGAEFDMLEDLRLPRAGQHLAPEGPTELSMAGRTVRLYGFHQIGEGISLTHYWLDDQGRLLLALGKMRAYIWRGESGSYAEGE